MGGDEKKTNIVHISKKVNEGYAMKTTFDLFEKK